MATPEDLTTLVCLFHYQHQVSAATEALFKQGVPPASISVIEQDGSEAASLLDELGVPVRDRKHLLDGLRHKGIIVAVSAINQHMAVVETIFDEHKATKINEATIKRQAVTPLAAAEDELVIPIVEEELVVGKRTMDQGGVRVYKRIVEIPIEESVNLRDEHVIVKRRAVDRPVTDADLALQGEQTIELIETAEEAAVRKTAYVVEEVVVGKIASERIEHIHDTVRHTETEVEQVVSESNTSALPGA